MKKKPVLKFFAGAEAKSESHLTDEQIRMAKELGLNIKKNGSYANHWQEPWKTPLPEFIEELYQKRSGKKV